MSARTHSSTVSWQALLGTAGRVLRGTWLAAGGAAVTLSLLATDGCSHKTRLELIQRRGSLIVITRNGPTSYYRGPRGKPKGFEYELVSRFADRLGVELDLRVAAEISDLLPAVRNGVADLAAAGLAITPQRAQHVDFSRPYQKIEEQVVYRAGTDDPDNIRDLASGELVVIAGSSYEDHLSKLQNEFPKLGWRSVQTGSIAPLLQKVVNGKIDYTIADSTMVKVHRRYFPTLTPAFSLGDKQSLAWALAPDSDALKAVVNQFLADMDQSGRLAALEERYYGHLQDFDFVGVRTFLHHVNTRLPSYRKIFKAAAEATGLDWRLLAAISYQESHWNPNAVSPTGVRGLMMLTQPTAHQLGIEDRTDVRASIFGGARYIKLMKQRLPDDIKEPNRTWLALAAYNIGMGHLEDARVITDIKDQDPDKWLQVKENLPLLTQKKWYSRVEYGYAPGYQAVEYVENIRSYYDILVWLTDDTDPVLQAAAQVGGPRKD